MEFFFFACANRHNSPQFTRVETFSFFFRRHIKPFSIRKSYPSGPGPGSYDWLLAPLSRRPVHVFPQALDHPERESFFF